MIRNLQEKKLISFYWLLMLKMHLQVRWVIAKQFIFKRKVGVTYIENLNDNSIDYSINRSSTASSAVPKGEPHKFVFISLSTACVSFKKTIQKSKFLGWKTYIWTILQLALVFRILLKLVENFFEYTTEIIIKKSSMSLLMGKLLK